MKTPSPLYFLISLFQIFRFGALLVWCQCLEDQRMLLVQLKSSLNFTNLNLTLQTSSKLVQWNQNNKRDCCHWAGVTCDDIGRVIGLDLNGESISELHSSSSLFQLKYLESLNLADNFFNRAHLPLELSKLNSLTYLNLSNSEFSGQIPVELTSLTRLVTLDLSCSYCDHLLVSPNLSTLLMKLPRVTALYLDGVNISTNRYDWCQVISSSLPNLKELSLHDCLLSGPLDSSLRKLHSLSVLKLSSNNFSAPVPDFLRDFNNLTILDLSSSQLIGHFPKKVLEIPTLTFLDLSDNGNLSGSLPEFPENGSLQTMRLSNTNFSGTLGSSAGNLVKLMRMELAYCRFIGSIPNAMANLTQLIYLDLSYNMFTGPIASNHFESHYNLVWIDLSFNAFSGDIPSSLFNLSSLQNIRLHDNHFEGLLPEFLNASYSKLETLYLSNNNLKGPIPPSFFNFKRLNVLSLSSNNLNGTVKLQALHAMSSLTYLDFSSNNLSVEAWNSNSRLPFLPSFSVLNLASCNLESFPNIKNHTDLGILDLSVNKIGGELPNWIWEKTFQRLYHLNLSHNLLTSLQEPYDISQMLVLDLHANQLSGKIPLLPKDVGYLDFSSNRFNSSLPIDIGHNLETNFFFSISNNMLTGTIPGSICQAGLLALDLSYNSLSSRIPSCLMDMVLTLSVLNLGNNNLSGNIPEFPRGCILHTLDLHGNHLEGKVPKSLGRCSMLGTLNLAQNLINDTFPCFLKKCTNLRVLTLRSNMLHGDILCVGESRVWPKLQIIDLASNYFTGHISRNFFLNKRAMIAEEDGEQEKHGHLQFVVLPAYPFYYVDAVTVTNKGLEMKLVTILYIFTSIDISNNMFSGEIPGTIGELKALYVLNMSHNALTGSIPASIGNLRQLGSLDLSVNNLAGKIPTEIGSLTFLSFLNLSYNRLEGKIPSGSQLQTFTETSFGGNKGLCGFQLNISCIFDEPPQSPSEEEDQRGESIVNPLSVEVGFIVGLATFIAPLVFCKKWSRWYYKHVEQTVVVKVYRYIERRSWERRNPIRRLD